MVRNILFDLGNVLIYCDLQKGAREIAERSNASSNEIISLLQDSLLDEFDEGRHTPEAFNTELSARIGWRGSSSELEKIWGDMLSPDERMFALMDQLRESGLQIYILSNINPYHIKLIRSSYPKVIATHGQIFSCECAMIKPSIKIFEHTRDSLQIEPQETLFIDDKEGNVSAAESVGFRSILHRSYEQTLRELESLLNLKLA